MFSSGRSGLWRWCMLTAFAVVVAGGCTKTAPMRTRVTIETTPEQGAWIMLDGVERGETPVVIENLRPGWVDVLVKKENYRQKADRIEVREGINETFVIEMEPLVGQLTVESTPRAHVYLDGASLERMTPIFNFRVMVGEHRYELRLENYYPAVKTFEVEADFPYHFVHTLKPMEATLSVYSRPSTARIWLNGRQQEQRTPAKFKLEPGIYIVDVYAKGFIQHGEKITLDPNSTHDVTIRLKQGDAPAGMVLVPAGTFLFGANERSPDEAPMREISLDAFYIDKFEVTNKSFKAVYPSHIFSDGSENMPVTGVSWEQAMAYASATHKRLPTEAEWEKAARGSDGREFPWGDEFDEQATNTQEAELGRTVEVGQLLGGMSSNGCMDMAGNAYEWTANWYQRYPDNELVHKDYGQIFRVLRGGSYRSPKFDARCARRHFDRMDATRSDYGFRCALDAKE